DPAAPPRRAARGRLWRVVPRLGRGLLRDRRRTGHRRRLHRAVARRAGLRARRGCCGGWATVGSTLFVLPLTAPLVAPYPRQLICVPAAFGLTRGSCASGAVAPMVGAVTPLPVVVLIRVPCCELCPKPA